jgi:DNA-binding NarL/FixJ family response regulator
MEKINIIVADDHQMIVEGIQFMLNSNDRYNLVYTANNTSDVLAYLENKKEEVHFILTDVNMPDISGIGLCKEIKKNYNDIKVLLLSMYSSNEIVKAAVQAEADGYILKSSDKKKLFEAIDRIMDNGTYFSEEIIPIIYNQYMIEKQIDINTSHLSSREKEILILIAQEYSSEEIGEKLFISAKTVGHHRQSVLIKCQCKTSIGLTKYAISAGLVKL